jgi:N-acetylmuramic acid 6-phosphate etherase
MGELNGERFLPSTELRADGMPALDTLSTLELVTLMNREDERAVAAVAEALPEVAQLVEAAVQRVRSGGSVHYFGAGTSGRLAFLDATELVPTFHLEPGIVVPHIAGGIEALTRAVEDAEDDVDAGARDAADITAADVVIGIAASGATPYVGGALRAGRERGALTALITCSREPQLGDLADLLVVADTGPEVLTGSTRLKAGTAQKLMLNSFSTALMVALGRTWSNLMVSVVATNAKLRRRTIRILAEALGTSNDDAAERLANADGDLRTALVVALTGAQSSDARASLEAHRGSVAGAIGALTAVPAQPQQHVTE